MASALHGCQNVLMTQTADTETKKMFGENDCSEKQTGFDISCCV